MGVYEMRIGVQPIKMCSCPRWTRPVLAETVKSPLLTGLRKPKHARPGLDVAGRISKKDTLEESSSSRSLGDAIDRLSIAAMIQTVCEA